MRHPVWFINMLALADWQDAGSTAAMLSFASTFINSYLDLTDVKGNKDAQALVNVIKRLYDRLGRLEKIVDHGCFFQTYRRVRGLSAL